MAYEERRVVTDDPVAAEPVETVRTEPTTVVEDRPRTVIREDPVGNAMAASQLIQTIVWSVVVLVLLVVALLALHVYAHLF
jgi:hypothetical protein